MGLIERLLPGPVALDTAVFIYHLEDHPQYSALLRPLFRAIDQGEISAVASPVAFLEVLVLPYRQGRLALAEHYETMFLHGRNLSVEPLSLSTAKIAAQLRAHHGLKTPDSLHLATAVEQNCSSFLTNDRRIPAPLGISVFQLNDFLDSDLVMEPPAPPYG